MSEQLNQEQMLQDIYTRVQAMGEIPDENKIRKMITEQFNLVMQDEDFVRKMRFGQQETPAKLVGTKYARWGLSIAEVEFLFDLQESLRGLKRPIRSGYYGGPTEELNNTFRAISEAFYMPMEQVREMDQRAIEDLFPRLPLAWFSEEDKEHAERGAFELTKAYQRAMRAMDTAESGYGSQLIGAQYVGDLWEASRRDSRIFGLIPSFEMMDPTAYLPVEADIPEMLYVSENTTYDASNYSTSKTGSNRVQVNAKKFVIHQMWSGEMDEDSIIPYIPYLYRQSQLSVNHYSDSLVLNGDTTNAATGNINLDDADPADTKHYLALDGIRHASLVDATDQVINQAGAGIDLDALRTVKKKLLDSTYLHDWGHPNDPNDLIYAADPDTADEIAAIDDVVTWYELQGRPLLTGQVANALGHPVIGSMAISKTEADGKVSTTAGNNTLGQVVAFNRRGAVTGWRRRVKLETERIPATDQSRMVHSLRLGFGRFTPTGAASGIKWTALIRNILLS